MSIASVPLFLSRRLGAFALLQRLPLRFVAFAAGSVGTLAGGLLLVQLAVELSVPRPDLLRLALAEADAPPPVETAEFQTPAEQAAAEPDGTDPYELTLDLARSNSIERMLADLHVAERERKWADEALAALLNDRSLATGEQINLVLQSLREPADGPRLVSLSVRPRPEREFIVTRRPDGTFAGEEKLYKVSPRFVRVNATLSTSILEDGTRAGAPPAAVNEFIKALSYDVDFQRELRAGQRFFLLLEQLVTSDGNISHPGRLLAGEFVLNSRVVSIVRFRPTGDADQFYNLRGDSIARSFLRTPLAAWKITSEFGLRQHPILGYGVMHKGVDFAAPEGAPVLAAGAGQVAFADNDGGHGLFVKIDHGSELATGYAHLSRLGPGIKPGVAVRQGQLIGFVGSTGLSTGPHLHYEFYRGGKAVDPVAEKAGMRSSLAGEDLEKFQAQVRDYVGQFKRAPAVGDGPTVIAPPAPAPPPAPPPVQAKAKAKASPTQNQAAREPAITNANRKTNAAKAVP